MTPNYKLRILPSAEKDITSMPEQTRARIIAAVSALAANPRPDGYRKMEGYGNMYRIRVGQYRIAYEIHDKHLLVIIACAASRDKIYRLLKRR